MGEPYPDGLGGVTLATPVGLWAPDGPHVVVHRTDPETLAYVAATDLGGTPGAFPPDAQSIAPGTEGIWVTLAAQRAVALMDPVSGEVVRRIEVDAQPYDLVEHDGDVWIADFEGSQVLRVRIDSGAELARIPVTDPTDIAYGEGSVWATVHIGRHDEAEPIEGNGGQLVRIDPVTNAVIATVDVGPRPYFVTTGFGAAWTGNATGGSVSRVDAATEEVTTIPIGADGAFDIEVLGDSVWVVIGPQYWSPECDPSTSYFVRIDPVTNAVDGKLSFPCPENLTPDGGRIWVQGYDEQGGRVGLVELIEP
jgi:streptogramin lyase